MILANMRAPILISTLIALTACGVKFEYIPIKDRDVAYVLLYLPDNRVRATIGGGSRVILPDDVEEAHAIARKVCGDTLDYKVNQFVPRDRGFSTAYFRCIAHNDEDEEPVRPPGAPAP